MSELHTWAITTSAASPDDGDAGFREHHRAVRGFTAVDGATFHVEEGEVVALVGRNGVGKTTTISAIAGMLRVAAGLIRLGEEDVTNWPSHRRATAGMALVAQGRRLFNGLTVQENLAVGESGSRRRMNRGFGWTVQEMYERFPVLYDRRKVPAG